MKSKVLRIIFVIFSILLLVYVSFTSPDFPEPPKESVQSDEPGDMETPLRRAYYTNLNRAEVIAHYQNQFNQMKYVPTLRLNYPPEEAQTMIRDQTKATFLEELTHPLRESLYISGFESKGTIYELKINDVVWKNKITVKYVPSNLYMRILVVLLMSISFYLLVREYLNVKKH